MRPDADAIARHEPRAQQSAGQPSRKELQFTIRQLTPFVAADQCDGVGEAIGHRVEVIADRLFDKARLI
ncbi:hypothetical protein D3C71_1373840 [compost metagenome]